MSVDLLDGDYGHPAMYHDHGQRYDDGTLRAHPLGVDGFCPVCRPEESDDTEIWRPIPGLEGKYDASTHGRFRSWIHWRDTPLPRVLRETVSNKGHLRPNLTGPLRNWQSHQLVLLTFVGPRPEGMVVRHLDGDPKNNRVENLAYGTLSDNVQDAVRHGTHYPTSRTQCPHDHPYSPENTVVDGGRRRCRTCRNEARRERRATGREAMR